MAQALAERARAELWLQGERVASSPGPIGHYWTGHSGTWFCTCGAGRPEACSCPQVP